jgi:WD40 repeat protein
MRIEKEEKILLQTNSMITSVALKNSGDLYISTFSGTLSIISPKGDHSSLTIVDNYKSITILLISDSGPSETLFMGCSDSKIYIRNLNFTENQSYLESHSSAILSLSFDPKQNLLFSGSSDTTVKIWNIKNNELLKTLTFNDSILSLSIMQSQSTSMCLVGAANRMISIIKCNMAEFSYEFFTIDEIDEVSCLNYVKCFENSLVVGLVSGNIEIWSFDQYKLKDLKKHQDRVTALACMNLGNREILISAGRDFKLVLWDIQNCEAILEINSHQHIITSLAVSSNSQEFFSGSWDGTARSFKLKHL